MGQQWIAAPTPHNSVWNEYLAVQDYWLACAALFMTALVELSIAIAVLQLWPLFATAVNSCWSECLANNGTCMDIDQCTILAQEFRS